MKKEPNQRATDATGLRPIVSDHSRSAKMRIFLLLLWVVSSATLFLAADFEVGWFKILRSFSPGFEWIMVLPVFCFVGGLLSALLAALLTVVMLRREKRKIWTSPSFVWNSILLFSYGALVVFSAARQP